jgi:hypothetical protein
MRRVVRIMAYELREEDWILVNNLPAKIVEARPSNDGDFECLISWDSGDSEEVGSVFCDPGEHFQVVWPN